MSGLQACALHDQRDNSAFFFPAWNRLDHCRLPPFFDSTDKQQHANTLRAPAAPAAQGEAPPPMDDLDHSDLQVWALAKEMHNNWSAVVGNIPN